MELLQLLMMTMLLRLQATMTMSMRLQELVILMMLQLLLMIPMVLQLKSLTVLQLLLMTLMEPLLMRTILRLQLIMMTTMRLLELLSPMVLLLLLMTPMVLQLKNPMELQLRPLSMVMLPEEDAPDSTTDVQPHPEATEDQLQEPDLLPGDQLLRLRHKELEDSSTGDHRTPEDSNRDSREDNNNSSNNRDASNSQGEDVVEDSSPSPSLTEDQLETLLPSVCLLLNNLYRLNLFNHVALAFTILC